MVDSADHLPAEKRAALKRARGLVVLGIVYLGSSIAALLAVMGRSQALKTEFIGDAMSLIAPVLFLIGDRISGRAPSPRYPYGFARAVSAAYLGAALALTAVGVILLVESASKLISAERPSIGGIEVFGHEIWLGWLALPTLAWSAVPSFFLGRSKARLGDELQDKVLVAEARTFAANWQSATAAMIGILGVAEGLWWCDALAAAIIAVEISRSGLMDLHAALADLMNRRPQAADGDSEEPLPARVTAMLKRQDWVADAVVRIREEGRSFTGEAFIVPVQDGPLTEQLAAASREACKLDWRLREMLLAPVPRIPPELEAVRAEPQTRSDVNRGPPEA
jgi:divalent metal cation (Fe/Co/Zn/Cd) transporter